MFVMFNGGKRLVSCHELLVLCGFRTESPKGIDTVALGSVAPRISLEQSICTSPNCDPCDPECCRNTASSRTPGCVTKITCSDLATSRPLKAGPFYVLSWIYHLFFRCRHFKCQSVSQRVQHSSHSRFKISTSKPSASMINSSQPSNPISYTKRLQVQNGTLSCVIKNLPTLWSIFSSCLKKISSHLTACSQLVDI